MTDRSPVARDRASALPWLVRALPLFLRELRREKCDFAIRLLSDIQPTGRDEADQLGLSLRLCLFEHVLQVGARRA